MLSSESDREVSRETSGEPENLAEIMARALGGKWEERECRRCGAVYASREENADDRCSECVRKAEGEERIKAEADSILPILDRYAVSWLKRAGMSPREIGARWDSIPAPIGVLLRDSRLEVSTLLSGRRPSKGFGLSGGAGVGKTFALAAIVKRMLRSRWEEAVPREGRAALGHSWLAWVSWPETVNKLRVMSTGEGGLEEAASLLEAMASIEILVLDDLGVERFRGTYETDWAASQLDGLIDTRYNEMRPTWFTTNLAARAFLDRYGARLFSRLCGENPLVEVPKGPDLRTRGGDRA